MIVFATGLLVLNFVLSVLALVRERLVERQRQQIVAQKLLLETYSQLCGNMALCIGDVLTSAVVLDNREHVELRIDHDVIADARRLINFKEAS